MEAWRNSLSPAESEALLYDWLFWARPEQVLPRELGQKKIWLLMAGRGFGKTRTEIEALRWLIYKQGRRHIALVGRTAGDVRDVLVEGVSGVLRVFPAHERPVYEPSKRRLTFPNGAVATTYSAEVPDSGRGPETDAVIADELAAWRYPEAWDNLMMGNRLPPYPIAIVATTPRPTPLIRSLKDDPDVIVTSGHTMVNRANIAPSFLNFVMRKYGGTRLGRQELGGELLDDTPGALWTRALIEAHRVKDFPPLVRVVVAIDPQVSDGDDEDTAETGIVVAGIGQDGHGYVLDDLTLRASPLGWANEAVSGYAEYGADRIVAEVNNGGAMVETTIRAVDKNVPYKAVHASRGKETRAEPISALYEQGRVHHVGLLPELEDEMCTWVKGQAKSPDRMDALVWALTELMLGEQEKLSAARVMLPNVYKPGNRYRLGRR